MARIFGWKLNNGLYAYITPVNGNNIGGKLSSNDVNNIISTTNSWTYNDYKPKYNELRTTVKTLYGIEMGECEPNFWSKGGASDIVIFDGKNGNGNGSSGGGGSDTDSGFELDDSKYLAFIAEIENKLNEAKERIKKDVEETIKGIEERFKNQIDDAKNDINNAKLDLEEINKNLKESLEAAIEAMKKAEDLFGDGEITKEDILDVIDDTKAAQEWITSNSGFITDFKVDYDATERIIGGIGTAEDATRGSLSRFATSFGVLSGTVGSVEAGMSAISGKVWQTAEWIDTSANTVTELGIYIDAKKGVIDELASYVNEAGSITNTVGRQINAASGSILDTIKTQTNSALTSIRSEMNGLSGVVKTTINRLNSQDNSITQLDEKMNASEGTIEKYLNYVNDISGTAKSLQDSWSLASGMIRSVSDLVANRDADGNVIYFYDPGDGGDAIRVYPKAKYTDNGTINKIEYYINKDLSGDPLSDEQAAKVRVDYSVALTSYIKQTSSAISMAISDGTDVAAAISVYMDKNKQGFIDMVAKEVKISGDLIASSVTSVMGKIGGVVISGGSISSMKENGNTHEPSWKLDGENGKITAHNAEIHGKIYADEGHFKGDVYAKNGSFSGDVYARSLTLGNGVDLGIEKMVEDALGDNVKTAVEEYLEDHGASIEAGDKILFSGYSITISDSSFTATDAYIIRDGVKKVLSTTYTDDKDNVYTNVGGGGNGSAYTKISKNGLLQANNAIIQGTIFANEGEIGGFNIKDSCLKTEDEKGHTTIMINGSDKYEDSDHGKIVIAAGLVNSEGDFNSDKTIYYVWTNSNAETYGLKNSYAVNDDILNKDKYKNGTPIILYEMEGENVISETINASVATHQSPDYDEQDDGIPENTKKIKIYSISNEGVSTGVLYSYSKSISADASNASTALYEDGTFITSKIIANDGYFKGDLNAKGYFSGLLRDAGGSIINAKITKSYISGDIAINSNNTLRANSSSACYLSISDSYIKTDNIDEKINLSNKTIEIQSRGKENTQSQTNYCIGSFKVRSGGTVTLPKMKVSYNFYIPDNRKVEQNDGPKYALFYKINTDTHNIHNYGIFNNSNESEMQHGWHSAVDTLEVSGFTVSQDSTISVYFTWSVLFPSASWLGIDKPWIGMYLTQSNSGKIDYPSSVPGFYIGPNGFKCITPNGYVMQMTDDGIEFSDPYGNHGLKITTMTSMLYNN